MFLPEEGTRGLGLESHSLLLMLLLFFFLYILRPTPLFPFKCSSQAKAVSCKVNTTKDLLGERMESIHVAYFTPPQLRLPFVVLF